MVLSHDFAGFKLYYQGKWDDEIFKKCIAVVGSRRLTEYGRRVVEKIVPQLVQNGWTIVSGFMYGVDQAAHAAAVECGGKTIAVLGWGINYEILDPRDQMLADKIIQTGGLLVSEWENQKPTLWTFPARNKIVAAISQEVIVVEAAIKSGSLITVELAQKLGKKIWAVPGPITSKVSEGTNMLIKTGQAEIYLTSPSAPLSTSVERGRGEVEKLLENEPLDASEIARKLTRPIEQIGAELSLLVLSGQIIERSGKYYLPVV